MAGRWRLGQSWVLRALSAPFLNGVTPSAVEGPVVPRRCHAERSAAEDLLFPTPRLSSNEQPRLAPRRKRHRPAHHNHRRRLFGPECLRRPTLFALSALNMQLSDVPNPPHSRLLLRHCQPGMPELPDAVLARGTLQLVGNLKSPDLAQHHGPSMSNTSVPADAHRAIPLRST